MINQFHINEGLFVSKFLNFPYQFFARLQSQDKKEEAPEESP